MNDTEKMVFHVALGAAIFFVGYHVGRGGFKRAMDPAPANAPDPMNPATWFVDYGQTWRGN